MTEPSQYFKGRTVQEQMNEIIGYVDVRAEEVAAAKADDVLEPAEQAKTDAIAAKEAAEDARDATLAALPTIQQDIADLKAEDVSLDGRLDTVELKVQTAEGNIVTIQGQIVALQTADGQNVKLTGPQAITGIKTVPTEATGVYSSQIANSTKVRNDIFGWAVTQTGNNIKSGNLTMNDSIVMQNANYGQRCMIAKSQNFDLNGTTDSSWDIFLSRLLDKNDNEVERDYVRKGSNYILAEKWYTFVADDQTVIHPSITINFNTATKLAIASIFGVEIARRQY